MRRRKNLKLAAAAFLMIGAVTLCFHTATKTAAATGFSGKEEFKVSYPSSIRDAVLKEEEKNENISCQIEMDSLNQGTPTEADLTMEEAAQTGLRYLKNIFEQDFTGANVFMMYESGTITFQHSFWSGDVLFGTERTPDAERWTFMLDSVTGELFTASYGKKLDVSVPLGLNEALEHDYGMYETLARELLKRCDLLEGEISSVEYNCQGYSGNDPDITLDVYGENNSAVSLTFSRYDQTLLGVGTDAERRISEASLENLPDGPHPDIEEISVKFDEALEDNDEVNGEVNRLESE